MDHRRIQQRLNSIDTTTKAASINREAFPEKSDYNRPQNRALVGEKNRLSIPKAAPEIGKHASQHTADQAETIHRKTKAHQAGPFSPITKKLLKRA